MQEIFSVLIFSVDFPWFPCVIFIASHGTPHLLSVSVYLTVYKAAHILKCYVNIAFLNHWPLEYNKSLQVSPWTFA